MNTHKLQEAARKWAPRLVLGGYLALALVFNLITPPFENSDEPWHYAYVKYVADGQGLPVAGRDRLLAQEATQPPLYYGLAAAVTAWVNSSDLPALLIPNPHWPDATARPANDNQNRYVHGPDQAFPWHGAALAVHLARLLSTGFGAVTVVLVLGVGRLLFPARPAVALTAAGLTAFNPQFIHTSAAVSNDSLVAALVTLAVWLTLRWLRADRLDSRRIAVLGGMCGLALLAKLSGAMAIVLVAVIVVAGRRTNRYPWPILLRWLALLAAGAVLVAGWWFVRNLTLYGDLTASQAHLAVAEQKGTISVSQALALWPEMERAYWIALGWAQLRPAPWVYDWLAAGRWLAMAGLAWFAVRCISRRLSDCRRSDWAALGLLAAWAALAVGLFLRWVTDVGTVSHSRLMYPAIAAFSLLLAWGWHQLVPSRWDAWVSAAAGGALAALATLSVPLLLMPAFVPSAPLRLADLPPAASRLDFRYGTDVALLAAEMPAEPGRAGTSLTPTFYWQSLKPPSANYSVYLRLLDAQGTVLAGRDSYPGLGLHPTTGMPVGAAIRDPIPLAVPDGLDAPLVARVVVGLYDYNTPDRLGIPATSSDGTPVPLPVAGEVKIVPTAWLLPDDGTAVGAHFADSIELAGYDLARQGGIRLRLLWRPLAKPAADYKVFVHVLDAAGQTISQQDARPRAGNYPTPWWEAGEIFWDVYQLPLDAAQQRAAVRLRIGLYDAASGARAAISGGGLPIQDNSLLLDLQAGK
jgi:hypothetical protein